MIRKTLGDRSCRKSPSLFSNERLSVIDDHVLVHLFAVVAVDVSVVVEVVVAVEEGVVLLLVVVFRPRRRLIGRRRVGSRLQSEVLSFFSPFSRHL